MLLHYYTWNTDIRDNRTPQITHVEVIKAERVFGDVKWDGL